jgi:hypothetical protein
MTAPVTLINYMIMPRAILPGITGLEAEPARGLEPLTTALQERCAANCATPAALAV